MNGTPSPGATGTTGSCSDTVDDYLLRVSAAWDAVAYGELPGPSR